jgi:hypothetical protein
MVRLAGTKRHRKAVPHNWDSTNQPLVTPKGAGQFKQVFEALRALMRAPEPARWPIGFVTPDEKKRA